MTLEELTLKINESDKIIERLIEETNFLSGDTKTCSLQTLQDILESHRKLLETLYELEKHESA